MKVSGFCGGAMEALFCENIAMTAVCGWAQARKYLCYVVQCWERLDEAVNCLKQVLS
jgi:hypothetical protein